VTQRPYRSVRVQLIVFITYIMVRKNQEDPVIPASKLADAPRDSPLIYQPARRYEAWRFLTYMFIHHQSVDVTSRIQQGSHSPGKPGKLLEFYVRPGIFGIISRFTHIKAKYSAYVFTTYFLQQVLTLIAFSYVW